MNKIAFYISYNKLVNEIFETKKTSLDEKKSHSKRIYH
jgi:hypothetical protein